MIHRRLNQVLLLTVFLTLIIFFNSCKLPSDPEEDDIKPNEPVTVVLTGQVANKVSGLPLDSALVRVISDTEEKVKLTDNEGKYSVDIKVHNNKSVLVIAMKNGYRPDTLMVNATASQNNVKLLELQPLTVPIGPSGRPASIFLFSQTSLSIGVKESGGNEIVHLVFEIQDSTGRAIDKNNAVDVTFAFGAKPDGGEFLDPVTVRSNEFGQVSTSLTSGTKAGVVQLIAEIKSGSKLIKSRPVAIAIHGGLPESNHFSVSVSMLNFPGYNIYGLTNTLTAYVGDRYGNPVRPGTIVYFTSTGGIIEGSAATDELGRGSVTLISAAPQPNHPQLGPGFATVTATTGDENNLTIETSGLVLFSGYPLLSITPTTFDIPNLGLQSFNYFVHDQNDNPLAGNTSIKVSVDGDDIKTFGSTDVILPDTQSRLWTQFSFSIADTDSLVKPRPVAVTITTTGPNGSNEITIFGTSK